MSKNKGYRHHEYKEFSSKTNGTEPDEEFEKFKSEIIPRSRLGLMNGGLLSEGRGLHPPQGIPDKGHGEVQRFYEYKEEKHPSGVYDRKDLHSVEQYTIPPKNVESAHYTYEQKQQRDVKNLSSNTYTTTTSSPPPVPAYSRSLEMSKELSHSVKELDTLLDDLQRDRERHTSYKSGYVSDNAERNYEYRTTTPVPRTAPSSGYSTLKSAEYVESYNSRNVERPPPPPITTSQKEITREHWREEHHGTEYRPPPPPITTSQKEISREHWREEHHGTEYRQPPPPITTNQKEITREQWREEHHESRAVPSQISPAIPKTVPPVQYTSYQPPVTPTPVNKVTKTVKTYTYEVPADQEVPIPGYTSTTEKSAYLAEHNTSTRSIPPSPVPVRHYDGGTRMVTKEYHAEDHVERHTPVPTRYQTYTDSSKQLSNERVMQNQTRQVLPNGIEPTVPGTYKWKETTYSAYDQTVTSGGVPPPAPIPVPAIQQPPKKLDDLMADFPDTKFPVEEKEHKVEVTKNVSGPPVYYPPEQKVKQSAAYEMKEGGGKWAKGKYEYEAQAKEKYKDKSGKKEYPVCLPLCCAMPCTIM